MTVQRRDALGADILRGLSFKRIGGGAYERRIESQRDLVAVLGDVFGLDLVRTADGQLPALWDRLEAADASWRVAQAD
jgi:N-hydroxyarylamine O-acetyltransferase